MTKNVEKKDKKIENEDKHGKIIIVKERGKKRQKEGTVEEGGMEMGKKRSREVM